MSETLTFRPDMQNVRAVWYWRLKECSAMGFRKACRFQWDMSVQLWAVAECQQVGRVTFERAQLCVASWDVAFPTEHRIFLSPKRANPLWNPSDTGSSFPWAKRSECVVDHWPLSSAEVKNEWSCFLLPLYTFGFSLPRQLKQCIFPFKNTCACQQVCVTGWGAPCSDHQIAVSKLIVKWQYIGTELFVCPTVKLH